MMKMYTIRRKIATIAVVCSLIMGLSLGVLSYLFSSDMADSDSKDYMLARAEERKTQFDGILTKIQQSVDTLTDISVGAHLRTLSHQKFYGRRV